MKSNPPIMAVWEKRPLCAGEVEFGRSVFADEIPWEGMRVLQAPGLGFGAFVPVGRTIVFSTWRAWRDFSHAPITEQAWFIHELTHAWQAARGVVLVAAKLRALGKKAYVYKARPGVKFSTFNIEQQAEIARHLFLDRMQAPAPDAPPRAWLERVWAER